MFGAFRRRSRGVRLTSRGTGTAAIGAVSIVAAYASSVRELVYLGVLALLLPLSAAVFVRFRRIRFEVVRAFSPEIVAVGEPLLVEVTITNAGVLATPPLIWRDRLPWGGLFRPRGTLPALVPRVGSGGTSSIPVHAALGSAAGARGGLGAPGAPGAPASAARVRYEVTPSRRGVFEIGTLTVVLEDPFGFARGEVSVGSTDRIVVTPRLPVLPDTGLAILASEGSTMLVNRSVGGEDDLSTREYRRGDALRRVHWRATARHGELMVRQEEPRSHAEARVVLDTRGAGYADRSQNGEDPESDAFEVAVSVASTIALHLSRGGFEVEFVETGHPQLASVTPLTPFLESTATVALSPLSGEYGPASLLTTASRPDRSQGSVFAVISDAEPATIDRLIAQRGSFGLAVVFVITWRASSSVERLRLAGWTTVLMRLDDTVEEAWRAIGEIHGVGNGR